MRGNTVWFTFGPPPVLPEDTRALRDWFAGQALIGLLAEGGPRGNVSQRAYEQADDMLTERAKS